MATDLSRRGKPLAGISREETILADGADGTVGSVLTVGLTGGIGSGKSTVATMLAEHGALVIDADSVAREVVLPGTPAHGAISSRFGPSVIGADGSVDRAALARVVFDDPAALADLNAIVHPAVGAAVDERLRVIAETDPDAVVVLEVPLLVETGWDKGDVVVVVDCPEEVAVRRLVAGRGMTDSDARRRVAAQATREERVARADWVVVNDGSLEEVKRKVDALWPKLPGPLLS
ncbi:MAG TPA: dephospho-CoA kinase [Acidimicrobiales bacterium]|nr:dephospho-CoA kinase [Acidimicrobiales bacterium]